MLSNVANVRHFLLGKGQLNVSLCNQTIHIRMLSFLLIQVRQSEKCLSRSQSISWWFHGQTRIYVARFGKSLSTCSFLAWTSVWHSTRLRAKYPNLLLFPYVPNLINYLLHWRFLPCPLWQTAGSGQQPMGSSLREVWSSQWSEWIRVMRDMQRRGSRMWQQLSFKVKLFRLRGDE